MKRVADQLAAVLQDEGITSTFQITGGDQALWIAFHQAGIRMVLGRSEQGATYMADGFARAAGHAALTYGQHGPGAANVAASLADAHWASSQVVALTSGVATRALDRFAYQELDQQALFRPVTRWSTSVRRADRAAAALRTAIRIARSGPQGPTHVDIPRDFIEQEAVDDTTAVAPSETFDRRDPDAAAVARIAERLSQAQRPLILAGAGAVKAGAGESLTALAQRLRIPVATTPGGKGIIAEGDELSVGQVGRYAGTVPNEIARGADVILVLGSRLGLLATSDATIPCQEAVILQVDIEPTSLARTYVPALTVLADARRMIDALDLAIVEPGPTWSTWASDVGARVSAWRERCRRPRTAAGAALHPADIIHELDASLPEQVALVADTGYMAAWAGVLFRAGAGRSFFRAAGSLGWAIPGAIGVGLASPGRPVVCVTGDGGAGYNLMELETAVRHRVPLIVVVLDNGGLAFEYHEQRYNWAGQVIPEANDYGPVEFASIGTALGASGEQVDSVTDLRRALQAAVRRSTPSVIQVMTDREAVAPVANYDRVLPREI